MSEDNVETKIPKLLLVSKESVEKEDFTKFMDPQVVKEENTLNEFHIKLSDLVKQVTSLSVMLGSIAPAVNWLQNWRPFRFSNMSDPQITQMQGSIEVWTRGLLADHNASQGTSHVVTQFQWVRHDDITFSLKAFLTPTAVVLPSGPGGGTSAVLNPKSPPQPPPPSL